MSGGLGCVFFSQRRSSANSDAPTSYDRPTTQQTSTPKTSTPNFPLPRIALIELRKAVTIRDAGFQLGLSVLCRPKASKGFGAKALGSRIQG